MDGTDVKEYLMRNDHDFRKLAQQHQEYERQLDTLLHRPYLNAQDQLQETTIKKKKLALKDRMQILIDRYRSEQSLR